MFYRLDRSTYDAAKADASPEGESISDSYPFAVNRWDAVLLRLTSSYGWFYSIIGQNEGLEAIGAERIADSWAHLAGEVDPPSLPDEASEGIVSTPVIPTKAPGLDEHAAQTALDEAAG